MAQKICYGVITEVPEDLKDIHGNYACELVLINPDPTNKCAGSNILVSPPDKDGKFMMQALKFTHEHDTTIDLTKQQALMCNTPCFQLGEIMIMDGEYGRTIPDGRKPSKWFVTYETFENIEDAIKRAKEVYDRK